MSPEFALGGVFISPIVPACVLALLLSGMLSFLLSRIGFYHLVWHRPLVDTAIFCVLLAVIGGAR